MLDRLVAFDTTSRRGNLGLIDFVRGHLEQHGARCQQSTDPSGTKANLHAMIGPAVAGGLALSGHVDTVPVEGQAWTRDPFRLHAAEGRLYGRGTSDMKGFVAAMLAAAPDIAAMDLARPVHLFMTFDEETTMAGARRLIETMGDDFPAPAMCVVGEPSLMEPVVGHKGRLAARAVVRGRPGHSSDPARGVNAIGAAVEAIAWLVTESRRVATMGPFADGFTPSYTTCQVGTIAGGQILNIIPEHCEWTLEWRPIPGDDARTALARLADYARTMLEPAMHAVDPTTGFTFHEMEWVPGMALPPDHALATLVRRAVGSNASGYVSYATEGGLFQEAGIPTIVCGPGSVTQAHVPDEWIDIAQLDAADAFIRRLAATLVR